MLSTLVAKMCSETKLSIGDSSTLIEVSRSSKMPPTSLRSVYGDSDLSIHSILSVMAPRIKDSNDEEEANVCK